MTREEAAWVLTELADEYEKYELSKNGWLGTSYIPAHRMGVVALRGPQPDPDTGLVPCGCGGKAILFHQPDIEGPGSDGDRWAVFCEKTCGIETSDMTSPEYAVETWNKALGWH